ncbi:hypothetical protein [Leptolyngbya ohadii]|uniref:hypothetical protein n=1 Tax=Leptolyngbya ohadii TaxID=1962290 RepID=UPI000B5A08CB|nr:hypothetical protein [Leptolyngbya ohadii]
MPRTRQQAASKIAPDSIGMPATRVPQRDAIAQITSVFDALPEKSKDIYTLREAVSQLDTPIRTALGRGYSYDEIAVILAEHEIAISAFSLKRYLSLNKTGKAQQAEGTGGKRRRGRQPKSESETAAQSADAVIDQRSQPEPALKRRGLAKSTVSEQSNVTEAVATLPETQPEAEPVPKRRGRTSKTAAKAKPAAQTTQRTEKGRGRK